MQFSQAVRQAIWLALPMYPSCNWEGEGPCPNLIQLAESAVERVEFLGVSESTRMPEQDEIDPRWEALRKLREQAMELRTALQTANSPGEKHRIEAELTELRKQRAELEVQRDHAFTRKMIMLGHLPPEADPGYR